MAGGAQGTLPFTTRFLVYRPSDPERFNGTVVVCWNNVTAGYELFHGESPEILEGGSRELPSVQCALVSYCNATWHRLAKKLRRSTAGLMRQRLDKLGESI